MKKNKTNKRDSQGVKNITLTAKTDNGVYEKAFLKMNKMQKRGRKSIYVSTEYHERLTRIIQIVGDDKIPLFAYLNNILEHHFRVFEERITQEFNEKYKGLF